MSEEKVHSEHEELIIKFIAGELSPEDSQRAIGLMEKDELLLGFYRRMQKVADFAKAKMESDKLNVEEAFKKFKARTVVDVPPKKSKEKSLTILITSIVSIAAAVLLYIGIVQNKGTENDSFQTLASNENVRTDTLSDGSILHLNAHSSVVWGNTIKERRVAKMTKGEILFDVVPNKEIPFIVDLPNCEVKVIGTTFNVLLDNDSNAIISVVEGKVLVTNKQNGDTLMLEANMNCRSSSSHLEKGMFENKNFLYWNHKTLKFTGQKLEDALKELERTYGIHIVLQDSSLASRKLSATYSNLEIESIFKILEKTLNVSVIKDENTFFVVKQN